MVCQPTVSLVGCTPEMVAAYHIYSIVWFAISIPVYAGVIILMIRRWWYLREPMNTFWAVFFILASGLPFESFYMISYLNYDLIHPPPPILMCITKWAQMEASGMTYIFVMGSWAQLATAANATKYTKYSILKWPWPLHVLLIENIVVLGVCGILGGFPQYYPYSERVIFGHIVFHVVFACGTLFYLRQRIIRFIAYLVQRNASSDTDQLKRAVDQIELQLKAMIGLAIMIAVLSVLHIVFLDYIDNHVWTTILVWCGYTGSYFFFVVGATVIYWIDTSFRIVSRQNMSSSRTSANVSITSNTGMSFSPSEKGV